MTDPLPPGGITLGEIESIAVTVWPGCGEFIAGRSAAVVRVVATLYGSAVVVTPEEAAKIRDLAGVGGCMLVGNRVGGPSL